MDFKVFVSYSTKDLHQVSALQSQLANTPINVFVAEHAINPSQELASTIDKAINNCDLFIVLWSNNAKSSDWVSQEIGKATALKKTILPLVLDSGLNLPGFISGLKYLPVFSDPENALVQAKEIVENEYKIKLDKAKSDKSQKDKSALALLGLSALVLWAVNRKPEEPPKIIY